MSLLDFITLFKGSYEKILLCFPFSIDNVKLYKFIEFDTTDYAYWKVLGFICRESMVIVDVCCH